MTFFTKIFGDPNKRYLKKLEPLVAQVNFLENSFKILSDDALRNKTAEFRDYLAKGRSLDSVLPEAFAAVREVSRRTLGQRHFDVQLLGGIVLHRGAIAEMRTGEGKTLTATLPVYLNALPGQGVHVVTVNDYLARRDTVWMGQIYHALGLVVGCINHESAYLYDPIFIKAQEHKSKEAKEQMNSTSHRPAGDGAGASIEELDEERDTVGNFHVVHEFLRPVSRKEAYQADITYGTNNEFGFDFLRDNMAQSLEDMVGRGYNYAIVDEVDSILIDEARTPLIISAPRAESSELYYKFAVIARNLREGEDYNVDLKMRAASITEAGINKVERALGVKNIYSSENFYLVHHMEAALRAQALFHRDKEYVVRPASAHGGESPRGEDGEVVIVDEFTGRLMFGRRYSEGLHQAIEAKEGVKIKEESQTLATITFQNYFRLYRKLSGMTGTALTEAEEFSKIYNLEVVSIPTNRPMVREDSSDKIYKTEEAKFLAVAQKVKAEHEKGVPVLLGTISIDKNEILSDLLSREGIPHNALNAKNHEREAEIIAQAGRRGAVTLATNMAGRGVDIILGGNPSNPEEAAAVRAIGGLCVIGTERHESRRIDNQLRGRSGRQGDPGASQFYVSLEDELMKIFGSGNLKTLMTRLGLPDDVPIENRIVSRAIEAAQHKVESHNFDIRKHLLEYDDVLSRHRDAIYKRRREILDVTDLEEKIFALVEVEIETLVTFHTNHAEAEWNLEEIYESAGTIFSLPPEARVKMEDIETRTQAEKFADAQARTKIIEYLCDKAKEAFWNLKRDTEGKTPLSIPTPPEVGEDVGAFNQILRLIFLRVIDYLWIEHLDSIDHLRTGIGLRGYGGIDPLIEYKREAFRLFQELQSLISKQVVYNIFKIGITASSPASPLLRRQNIRMSAPAKESGEEHHHSGAQTVQKIGRNEPCFCGSGKKYKRCHGQ